MRVPEHTLEQEEQASGVDTTHQLPTMMVQTEWDRTLDRIREIAPVVDYTPHVNYGRHAMVRLKKSEGLSVEAIERALFQNLLLAPCTRTEHEGEVYWISEWLWRWRKSVPFHSMKVGSVMRLVPGTPQAQWTYHFDL